MGYDFLHHAGLCPEHALIGSGTDRSAQWNEEHFPVPLALQSEFPQRIRGTFEEPGGATRQSNEQYQEENKIMVTGISFGRVSHFSPSLVSEYALEASNSRLRIQRRERLKRRIGEAEKVGD
jgi:hypothetical protein